MIELEKNKKKIVVLICFFAIILLVICFVPIKQDNYIKIIYSGLPAEAHWLSAETTGKMVVEYSSGVREQQGTTDDESYSLYEITYHLDEVNEEITNLSFELQYGSTESYVKAIEIYNHMTQVKHLAPKEIVEYFECGEGENYYFDGPYVVFTTQDESPTLVGTNLLQKEINQILKDDRAIRINAVVWYLFITALLFCGVFLRDQIWMLIKNIQGILKQGIIYLYNWVCWVYQRKYYIGVFFLIIAETFVIFMAMKSRLYAHPDETVTRVAIDYYLGNWMRPSMYSGWVAGTFSPSGSTRLIEHTWYYLFAGKVGWLFAVLTPFTTYFRMFNVILFSIMVGITVKYGKKESWMFLVLLSTPQLWYLFSYATSDAYDFFWSFIITFELIHEKSIMRRFLEEKTRHKFLSILWCGFLFSNIFLAKRNFYCVLLFAFVVLAFRLFPLQKKKTIIQIKKYCEILFSTYVFYFIKMKLDEIMSYFNSLPVFSYTQAYSGTEVVRAVEEGYSIKELFTEKALGESLFGSFIGAYGWMSFWNDDRHTHFVAVLYIVLIGILVYLMIRMKWKDKLETLCMFAICLLMFVMVVRQCWLGDYQPQGRYMLPILLVLGYVTAKRREKTSDALLALVMFLIAIASVYSFYHVGLQSLVIPYL